MVIFKYTYYILFSIVSFIKDEFPGIRYNNPPFTAAILLTIIQVVNVITIFNLLKINHVTYTQSSDILFVSIILFSINYYLYMYKQKYKFIIEMIHLNKYKKLYYILSFTYIVLSIYLVLTV